MLIADVLDAMVSESFLCEQLEEREKYYLQMHTNSARVLRSGCVPEKVGVSKKGLNKK
jgi:hypothetical protein